MYQRRDGLGPVLLNKRVIVTGDQMVGAQAVTDPNSGSPAVSVTLNNGTSACSTSPAPT